MLHKHKVHEHEAVLLQTCKCRSYLGSNGAAGRKQTRKTITSAAAEKGHGAMVPDLHVPSIGSKLQQLSQINPIRW